MATIKVVSWNIGHRIKPWTELLAMGADLALSQETGDPPAGVVSRLVGWGGGQDSDSRGLYDRWPLVVQLSERIKVDWFDPVSPLDRLTSGKFVASDLSTIALARVEAPGVLPFVAVSMYARWMKPHPITDSKWSVGYPDGSAHRVISDISSFIGSTDPAHHRILAAGDLNMIYGATADNRLALPARDRTVTDRMNALGLEFLGPQYPNGRKARPTPRGLPANTANVPTYYTSRQNPETAQNQLDYVFASRGFHLLIKAKAINLVEQWGSSDHCRLLIEIGSSGN